MEEIRIVHTADTHLGYRQYHSDVRRKDFLNAFSTVVNDAIEMGVDAVVHAGDLFDSRNPTLDDILDAMELFSRLKNAGIPLFAIVGNHESKQTTQWLDLYSSLGLVIRLGAQAQRIGDVAIYGIDSVPKTKIPLFDYSVFDAEGTDAKYNLLVMHQLMKPFSFGDWDVQEVVEAIPFDIHAVLLGDNHKYEVTKVGETWVTYCGSTERNSTSEREPRSYNIITAGEEGIEISKRIIPTREFVFIPVKLSEGEDGLESIFSVIKEHDVSEKVVFVELSGDVKSRLDFSEIEKFLLSRGVLVPGIKDLRSGVDTLEDPSMKVTFSDPDDVVREEIKKMNLTSGGLLLDELIRDPQVVKTRVGDEAELKLGELLEKIDFSEPVPVHNPITLEDSESDDNSGFDETGEVNDLADSDAQTPTLAETAVDVLPSEQDIVSESREEYGTDENVADKEEPSLPAGKPEDSESGSSKVIDKKDEPEGSEGSDESEKPAEADNTTNNDKHDDKGHSAVKPRQYNLGDYL